MGGAIACGRWGRGGNEEDICRENGNLVSREVSMQMQGGKRDGVGRWKAMGRGGAKPGFLGFQSLPHCPRRGQGGSLGRKTKARKCV